MHGPGCAHYQQLIWELFNGVEKGWEFSGDDDVAFLAGAFFRSRPTVGLVDSISFEGRGPREKGKTGSRIARRLVGSTPRSVQLCFKLTHSALP